jgi:hypothetical protein
MTNQRDGRRPVLIIVPEWPGGTMAIKFGSALKVALQVEADGWSLLQMEPERIFRAVTAVSESELRQALAQDFASIRFKYVNMKLVPDDIADGRTK